MWTNEPYCKVLTKMLMFPNFWQIYLKSPHQCNKLSQINTWTHSECVFQLLIWISGRTQSELKCVCVCVCVCDLELMADRHHSLDFTHKRFSHTHTHTHTHLCYSFSDTIEPVGPAARHSTAPSSWHEFNTH